MHESLYGKLLNPSTCALKGLEYIYITDSNSFQSQRNEVEHRSTIRSISLFAAGESEGPYIQPFRIGNNKINKEAVKDLILAT